MSFKDFFTSEPTPEILDLTRDMAVKSRRELQTAIDRLNGARTETETIDQGELLMKANEVQVGGDHYKNHTIQPWDAITAWKLGFLDGNAVKYLARWRTKSGLQDLRKAQHYITKLIEEEKLRLVAAGLPVPAPSAPDIEPTEPTNAQDGERIAADKEEVDADAVAMAERLTRANPPKMKTRPADTLLTDPTPPPSVKIKMPKVKVKA